MKRLLSVVAALTCLTVVRAAEGDLEHNVGQGLGTLLFRGQNGLVQQVLAATTNGCFGNQTFAITSGTLGAKQADSLVQNETLNRFVADNMDNLARDIAVGEGESLATLASLVGVSAEEHAIFANKLRDNFDSIYSSDDVTSDEVVKAIAQLCS